MKARIFAFWMIIFLLGISCSSFFELQPQTYFVIFIVIGLVSILVIDNRKLWITIVSISVFFFGIFLSQNQEQRYKKINKDLSGKNYKFIAIIDEIPVQSKYGKVAQLRILNINDQIIDSRILAYFNQNLNPVFNQKIGFYSEIREYKPEITGRLIKQKVIGEISINKFEDLGENQVFTIKNFLYLIRQTINSSISRLLPKEEAGLASGLIMGEKAYISERDKTLMQNAGVTHIIALSGYNITIILGLLAFLKNRYSRNINLVVPLLLIVIFIIMTGAAASIVRAGIMGMMPVIARYLGRPKNNFIAILFSASLMVLFNPFILLYDIGFQLSFLAIIGLMYFSPIILARIKNSFMIQTMAESFSAQILVVPLIIYYFGVVSIISPISNVVILSLVPIGMLAAFIVGVVGSINYYLGHIVAVPGYLILKMINYLITFFGSISFAAVNFKINNFLWIIFYYLIIVMIYFIVKNKNKIDLL